KPFTPPPGQPVGQPIEPPPATAHVRGSILVTLVAAIVVTALIVWIIRTPSPEPSTAKPAPLDPPALAKNEPPKTDRPSLLPEPIAVKPNKNPRVRTIVAVEPTGPSLLSPVERKPHSSAVPQEAVDKAIANGIEFLKKNPHRWLVDHEHAIGYAS